MHSLSVKIYNWASNDLNIYDESIAPITTLLTILFAQIRNVSIFITKHVSDISYSHR